jgi:hypothetical protein
MVRKLKNIELVIREFVDATPQKQYVLSIEQGKEDRGCIVICSGEKEDVYSFAELVQNTFRVLGFGVERKENKL